MSTKSNALVVTPAAKKAGAKAAGSGRTGRPSSYDPEYVVWVENLTKLHKGITVEDIAKYLGFSPTTVKSWMKKYPDFLAAVTRAREIDDSIVARSLFDLANGYYYDAEELVKLKAPGGGERIERVYVKKYVPKNFNAQSLWMRNRFGDAWKAAPENNAGEALGPITGITVSIQDPTASKAPSGDEGTSDSKGA